MCRKKVGVVVGAKEAPYCFFDVLDVCLFCFFLFWTRFLSLMCSTDLRRFRSLRSLDPQKVPTC